jgi:hypothetical protein
MDKSVTYSEPRILINENKLDMTKLIEETKSLVKKIYEKYKEYWIAKEFKVVFKNPPMKLISPHDDNDVEIVITVEKMINLDDPFKFHVEIYVDKVLCEFDVCIKG